MEITPDLIMQYGLMSKMSTGNTLLDTVLVMLVPLLVTHLLPKIREFISNLFTRKPHVENSHERIITHKQKSGYHWYSGEEDEINHKLQQAILIYLNSVPDLFSQLEAADVRLVKAKRTTPAAAHDGADSCTASQCDGGDNDNDDDDASSSESCSWYPGMELEEFEPKMVPPVNTWITIEPGLTFQRSEERISNDKESELVVTYTLVGKSAAQVDEFIARAYEAYRNMLKGEQKDQKANRYLYLPVLVRGSGGDGEGGDHMTYRRYKLSDDKSFDNLFHPDKNTILTLVENFSNKRGKFGIKGYPQKLGFLLHGPPGTGKTTFIKALAAHTKRSIINIPLSRIKTNQQLMDMMFDQRVKVDGEDMKVPLPFNKVIYVMEDVDAASHVVQKRASPDALAATLASLMQQKDKSHLGLTGLTGQARGLTGQARPLSGLTTTTTTTTAVKVTPAGCAGDAAEADAKVRLAGNVSGIEGQQAAGGQVVELMARACSVTHLEDDTQLMRDVSPEPAAPVAGPANKPGASAAAFLSAGGLGLGGSSGNDELNLAGLLNVLDGVVDTPGRIVIMSTNHPEKLDPALIRPGRVNKKVYMGHIAGPEALLMVQHYFGELTGQQREQLLGSWVDGVVSPAALEALCAEFEEVEELLAAVQQLVVITGGSIRATTQQQPQQQKQQEKQDKAASGCCEGSGAAAGGCVVIRASSCASSFTSAGSPFAAVACFDDSS